MNNSPISLKDENLEALRKNNESSKVVEETQPTEVPIIEETPVNQAPEVAEPQAVVDTPVSDYGVESTSVEQQETNNIDLAVELGEIKKELKFINEKMDKLLDQKNEVKAEVNNAIEEHMTNDEYNQIKEEITAEQSPIVEAPAVQEMQAPAIDVAPVIADAPAAPVQSASEAAPVISQQPQVPVQPIGPEPVQPVQPQPAIGDVQPVADYQPEIQEGPAMTM